ncbi:hypothetical protein [Corynebacterium sp.]|uniref:hypothetical protein n=1 Tax=Corynebacterium sp. TaxID=1720 RepID=UPI0025BC7071|nr:hypothetical protein [Corynebacterium sp.]
MQDLYVFQSAVEGKTSSDDPWSIGLSILAKWISRTMGDTVISAPDLLTSGNIGRVPSRNGGEKSAAWKYLNHSNGQMVRIDVLDHFPEGDQTLQTRTTFGTDKNGRYALRVVVSRESTTGSLSPLRKADVRQPGLVRDFVNDYRLRCFIGLDILETKYVNVRNQEETNSLIQYIHTDHRLPVLIIHSRTLEAISAAKECANKLIGLLRVFTVDYRSKLEIDRQAPGMAPQKSAAVLVWPDRQVNSEQFSWQVVNSDDRNELRTRLMERLSLVSVMRRGRDEIFASAQAGAAADRAAEEKAEQSRILSISNKEEIISSLEQRLAKSREDTQTWKEMAESIEADLEGLQSSQADITSLQRNNEYLQEQIDNLQEALSAVGSANNVRKQDTVPEADQWDGVPSLRSGDQNSMERLIHDLEDRSMDRIVFSRRVSKEWKRAKYPFPDEMVDALTSMAKLAVSYWEEGESLDGNWKDVFMERFGLNFAPFDRAISSDSGLRDFSYEGKTYERTPHIKLRDNTSPERCGRIYFAIDDKKGRFIVDHVGTKIHTVGIRS